MVHAVVVADGHTPDRAALDRAWPDWQNGVVLVVAADAGAVGAEALGLAIDLVVGDGDSLGPAGVARFRAAGVEVRLSPAEKDARSHRGRALAQLLPSLRALAG